MGLVWIAAILLVTAIIGAQAGLFTLPSAFQSSLSSTGSETDTPDSGNGQTTAKSVDSLSPGAQKPIDYDLHVKELHPEPNDATLPTTSSVVGLTWLVAVLFQL